MIKLGIVVQRYGNEVVGGSETLARQVAERLNNSGFDVSVFTTTAMDYITWKNEFKRGDSILKGVNIHRFPVEKERDIKQFDEFSESFFRQPALQREQDEKEWLLRQGPYSPELIDTLQKRQGEFDLFLFFTYLYYPTIEGLKIIEKRCALFPTGHDEPPIYLDMMKHVFQKPNTLFFLTAGEMDFVQRTFPGSNRRVLVRTGIDFNDTVTPQRFQHGYLQYAPYMLYAGRIEKGKGLEKVFDAFREIKKHDLVDLVLIGKQLMDIPREEGIRYLGFLPEEDKLSAFRGAAASVQPSPLESLSITTLESFSQQTPVLVNGKSAVLCEHVNVSGGGFAYNDTDDFIRCFRELLKKPALRRKMGLNGYEYARKYYSWDVVIDQLGSELRKLVSR